MEEETYALYQAYLGRLQILDNLELGGKLARQAKIVIREEFDRQYADDFRGASESLRQAYHNITRSLEADLGSYCDRTTELAGTLLSKLKESGFLGIDSI